MMLGFAYSAARESIVELGSKEEMEACDVSNPIRMANKMTSSSVENNSYAGKPHRDNSDDSNLDSNLVLGRFRNSCCFVRIGWRKGGIRWTLPGRTHLKDGIYGR
ncbi:hypothetical protein NE237_030795 [Protea cynaroides]|uniref:Uncharacterized protein n=1 Tax=Protea cynaroides TaxID=273540 RepID=A0A9Q0GWL9_9MAGN|nr:hypothetical protein NE237_030795 [Protea cynaroides]